MMNKLKQTADDNEQKRGNGMQYTMTTFGACDRCESDDLYVTVVETQDGWECSFCDNCLAAMGATVIEDDEGGK